MAVKFGFFIALVAITLAVLATESAAAPPAVSSVRVWETQNQLVDETAGTVELSPEGLEQTRVRRSPKVCRHIIVHNKKNGLNYPYWECN